MDGFRDHSSVMSVLGLEHPRDVVIMRRKFPRGAQMQSLLSLDESQYTAGREFGLSSTSVGCVQLRNFVWEINELTSAGATTSLQK